MAFVQNFHQNAMVFQLGQLAPAFTFPSLTTSFSISDLYTALIEGSSFNQAIVYAVPGKMRLPTVDAWNFTVQHELSSTSYFELGYVGNKGTHVFTDGTDRAPQQSGYYDLNQARVEGFNSVPKVSKPSRQPFNPWPTPVRYFGNDASNNYNSLQAKVNKIFRHGYEFWLTTRGPKDLIMTTFISTWTQRCQGQVMAGATSTARTLSCLRTCGHFRWGGASLC